MRRASLLLVLLSAIATACARSAEPGEPSAPAGRNVITSEQIQERHFTNAYDAVAALRPAWLRARGVDSARSPAQVLVYVDNMRVGGVESLRSIDTGTVGYIRYYDANEATARWGMDHGQGVIFVSSR